MKNRNKKLSICLYIIALVPVIMVYFGGSIYAGNAAVDATEGILGEIGRIIALIASFVCLAKVIQIGIMYMLSGAGNKSQAKSAILPWLIGTVICGAYVALGQPIIDAFRSAGGTSVLNPGNPDKAIGDIGSMILGWVSALAGAVAFGMLLYIGIKYMTSSALDKAKAKDTFIPWIVGLLIVSSASGIMNLAISAAGAAGSATQKEIQQQNQNKQSTTNPQ